MNRTTLLIIMAIAVSITSSGCTFGMKVGQRCNPKDPSQEVFEEAEFFVSGECKKHSEMSVDEQVEILENVNVSNN